MTAPAADAPVIVWFRSDLRLSDHPALHAAVATGAPVLCIYILDERSAGVRPPGGAARWWLHHGLADLGDSLQAIGGRLDLFEGEAEPIVLSLVAATGAAGVYWSHRYGAGERAMDAAIEAALAARGVAVHGFNGRLLHEPEQVRAKSGGAFKVFTPYLRASLVLGGPGQPLPPPRAIMAAPRPAGVMGLATLEGLRLLPRKPDWAGGLRDTWVPGEAEAQRRLRSFLDDGLAHYAEDRNRPAVDATSGLSPYLRHGHVSPRQIVAQARHAADAGTARPEEVDKFVAEVTWRDFAYAQLAAHPDLATTPMQPAYADFPFRPAAGPEFAAWQRGQTGYPIVDAGMRQLWATGVMHNRIRMVTASFLVKHLLIDWRAGERWFWDTLCDADPANNPFNWQWVAGCGADAAPYFRIFNPVLQGERFDAAGDYVRRFVPELERMPKAWIHKPWEAPPQVLQAAGVTLGKTYPQPIVEHGVARERALKALGAMRAQRSAGSSPQR